MTAKRAQELGRVLTPDDSYYGTLIRVTGGCSSKEVLADIHFPGKVQRWGAVIHGEGKIIYPIVEKPDPDLLSDANPKKKATIVIPRLLT